MTTYPVLSQKPSDDPQKPSITDVAFGPAGRVVLRDFHNCPEVPMETFSDLSIYAIYARVQDNSIPQWHEFSIHGNERVLRSDVHKKCTIVIGSDDAKDFSIAAKIMYEAWEKHKISKSKQSRSFSFSGKGDYMLRISTDNKAYLYLDKFPYPRLEFDSPKGIAKLAESIDAGLEWLKSYNPSP